MAQDLVRRAHHPSGLRVADVALELHVALVAAAAAGVEHLVDVVGDVLRRLELDLPRPVQEVRARELAGLEDLRVVVGRPVHRLRDRDHEEAAGVRVHDRLADVVLDRRVVRDAHADVDVALAGRVALGDVDRTEGDAVPDRARPDQEPRVDRFVVRRGAVADRADDLVAGDLDVLDLDRPGLVAAQAERVPQRRVRLHVLAVDDEDRQVVVAGEVGRRRLHDVEVGEAAGRGPRRFLADLVAAVGPLGAGGERVPEVRAGLRVRVRQRAELAAVERADVLLDQFGRRAQHQRLHRGHVHHVAHGGGRAAVARDGLADHAERDVVLTQAAVLLGHGEGEEAVLAHELEVAPREQELVVRALGVRAHLLLAELDELLAQLLLAVGEHPVGVPLVAEAPERLSAPRLVVGHRALLAYWTNSFTIALRVSYRSGPPVSTAPPRGRHPSGATQTRHGASRRTRRSAARRRGPRIRPVDGPKTSSPASRSATSWSSARTGRRLEMRKSSVAMPSAAARLAVSRTSSRASSCGSVAFSAPTSMTVAGYGGSCTMLATISGTPASSALAIAISSAAGSIRTCSVASTTGRARVRAVAAGAAIRSRSLTSAMPSSRPPIIRPVGPRSPLEKRHNFG